MEEHKLPDGTTMFHLHRGECVFLYEEIFVRRCYQRHGLGLQPGAAGCVLDVGANIGMACHSFNRSSPGILIHAVEPSPQTFDVLKANVERLGINAKLHRCALAASSGVGQLTHYVNRSTMSGLFADAGDDKQTTKAYMVNEGMPPEDAEYLLSGTFATEVISCSVRTLSEIIDENDIDRIELLKVDVEKAELDVMRGIHAEHWKRVHQLVVEVHDISGRVMEMKSLIEQAGFKVAIDQDRSLKNTALFDLYAWRSPPH